MSKLIIENRTGLTTEKALRLVLKVVELGRISNDNKQYCYLTSFNIGDNEYHVTTDLNKRSDRFVIYAPPVKTPSYIIEQADRPARKPYKED